jgi:hypothetical protein
VTLFPYTTLFRSEKHHPLDPDVQNSRALVNQLAEASKGENHGGFKAPGDEL